MSTEKRLPIPRIFHSLEFDGPFRECLICKADLLAGLEYLINRVFNAAEPILEYAICQGCHGEMSNEMSPESKQKISDYLWQSWSVDGMVQRGLAMANEQVTVDELLEHCLMTNAHVSECRERQICGAFVGDAVILDSARPFFPMMLSGDFVRSMDALLSETTRGWMEDFVGEQFGMSPDLVGMPSLL